MRRPFIALAVALTIFSVRTAAAFEKTFWVWQRASPLTAEETAILKESGISRIFWHVGELTNVGDDWQWQTRFYLPDNSAALRFVPVVRLVSKERAPFVERSLDRLRGLLEAAAQPVGEIQLDYDCPDRLVPEYAAALKSLRQSTGRLTVTALPHWSRSGLVSAFPGCVDALFPMFYDFEPEPVLPNDGPHPLIDPAAMDRMLRDWSSSPLPWYAGLPTFARVTAYDGNGKSRGHIRNWTWDEISFNRLLVNEVCAKPATFILRATQSLRISKSELHAGDRLVVRLSRADLLENSARLAESAGAKGTALFRFPDGSAAAGCSLRQLCDLHGKADLTVMKSPSGSTLQIENKGNGDLLPSLDSGSPAPRGYWLEIAAEKPIFREAEPGDFVAAAGAPEQEGSGKVPIPFARRISFAFSDLPAGKILETGLIQLAPGASFNQTRYRIQPIVHEWKTLD